MKWVGRLVTSVAAALLTAGGASASTQAPGTLADAAWASALKSDSLEAYAAFVMTHPDSEHVRAAYDRLAGADPATVGAGAMSQAAGLLGDNQNKQSSPGISPGMIMII